GDELPFGRQPIPAAGPHRLELAQIGQISLPDGGVRVAGADLDREHEVAAAPQLGTLVRGQAIGGRVTRNGRVQPAGGLGDRGAPSRGGRRGARADGTGQTEDEADEERKPGRAFASGDGRSHGVPSRGGRWSRNFKAPSSAAARRRTVSSSKGRPMT